MNRKSASVRWEYATGQKPLKSTSGGRSNMKFKAQEKQNQLIENITVHHLVVGVDIAQEVHVARAVSFRGIALGTPLKFVNHLEGFNFLKRWIQDLLKSYKLQKVIVGMEPTGTLLA